MNEFCIVMSFLFCIVMLSSAGLLDSKFAVLFLLAKLQTWLPQSVIDCSAPCVLVKTLKTLQWNRNCQVVSQPHIFWNHSCVHFGHQLCCRWVLNVKVEELIGARGAICLFIGVSSIMESHWAWRHFCSRCPSSVQSFHKDDFLRKGSIL